MCFFKIRYIFTCDSNVACQAHTWRWPSINMTLYLLTWLKMWISLVISVRTRESNWILIHKLFDFCVTWLNWKNEQWFNMLCYVQDSWILMHIFLYLWTLIKGSLYLFWVIIVEVFRKKRYEAHLLKTLILSGFIQVKCMSTTKHLCDSYKPQLVTSFINVILYQRHLKTSTWNYDCVRLL